MEALRFRSAGDVQELKAGHHGGVHRRLLLWTPIAVLGDNGHRELLVADLTERAFDAYERRRTEESLLASIGLLGDGGVQTDDGRHVHDPVMVLAHMRVDRPANLRVRLLRLRVLQSPLAR